MKFEFYSKSLEYDPDLTKVILTTAEGGNVPVYLPADLINLSNQELFEKALDKIYEINFPMRAENEKFNTMGEKIAQFDDANAGFDKRLSRLERDYSALHKLVLEDIGKRTGEVNEVTKDSDAEHEVEIEE